MTARESSRLAGFEARVTRPRQVLALVWLPVLVGARVGGPAWVEVPLGAASNGIWLFFLVEYLWRLRLAPDRRSYAKSHLFDVAALVFPPLRGLWGLAPVRAVVRQPGFGVFLASMLVVVLTAAALVFALERDAAGANIDTLGDAIWWAFVSATTVGYGDHTPVSGLGRAVAGGLILVGVVLYAVVTAHITAFVLDRSRSRWDTDLAERLETVVARLERLERAGGPPVVGPRHIATRPGSSEP